MSRPLPPVDRVVMRPPNWLGDAVLALPAMTAVRRAFPAAHLAVAAPSAVASLFREDTAVEPDEVVELPSTPAATAAALARGQFELGVLFPNSFRSAWLMRRAGISERWGYARSGRGWVLTRKSARERSRGRHQADYYRALVRGLGIPCGDEDPALVVSEASQARADALLEQAGVDLTGAGRAGVVGLPPLVGLAPGAAYGQAKQWPPARVADMAARLVRDAGVTCVIVGASHDRDAARAIESWLRAEAPDALPRVIDLVGRTSVGTLAGVMARTGVFVSNDSGAMHLAAAIGRPVVAVFGPTDERATRPLGDHDVLTASAFCRPCLMRDCPIDHRCMKRIPVTRVLDAVIGRLAPGGGA